MEITFRAILYSIYIASTYLENPFNNSETRCMATVREVGANGRWIDDTGTCVLSPINLTLSWARSQEWCKSLAEKGMDGWVGELITLETPEQVEIVRVIAEGIATMLSSSEDVNFIRPLGFWIGGRLDVCGAVDDALMGYIDPYWTSSVTNVSEEKMEYRVKAINFKDWDWSLEMITERTLLAHTPFGDRVAFTGSEFEHAI